MLRSDRKPPLAVRSPIRLRPRRPLQPAATTTTTNNLETPPGSLMKPHLPKRCAGVEDPELRPEYRTISCELRALAKRVNQEFDEDGISCSVPVNVNRSPLFERGRFYEVYAAKRNERLKRKKSEEAAKSALGVRVESAKKRDVKKVESARKSMTTMKAAVAATPMREVMVSRYSLRSSSCKENVKPPLSMKFERSASTVERETSRVRSGRNLRVSQVSTFGG